jgi:hypothetical protein
MCVAIVVRLHDVGVSWCYGVERRQPCSCVDFCANGGCDVNGCGQGLEVEGAM